MPCPVKIAARPPDQAAAEGRRRAPEVRAAESVAQADLAGAVGIAKRQRCSDQERREPRIGGRELLEHDVLRGAADARATERLRVGEPGEVLAVGLSDELVQRRTGRESPRGEPVECDTQRLRYRLRK